MSEGPGGARRPAPRRDDARGGEAGQVLVLVAAGMLGIIAIAALVIEGGNLFAQQRISQNGADASANAGTIVIAEGLSGASRGGADVASAVAAAAAANRLVDLAAEYVAGTGQPLTPPAALDLAHPAGNGSIPPGARGVHVSGGRTVATSFARIIGIDQVKATADATAIAGAVAGVCSAAAGCGLLPVTFPVAVSICSPKGHLDPYFYGIGVPPNPDDPASPYWPIVSADQRTSGTMAIVPLCKIDPGSVGWLDLGPGNLASEIEDPRNGSITIPNWFQTKTGNVNAVEDEINDNYANSVVLVPLFDGTCRVNPGPGTPYDACPEDQKGVGDPTGSNTWYHVPAFTAFWLDRAYIAGANVGACSSSPGWPLVDPGTPGFLGCVKGWFVRYIVDGPVDPNGQVEPFTTVAVQLVR